MLGSVSGRSICLSTSEVRFSWIIGGRCEEEDVHFVILEDCGTEFLLYVADTKASERTSLSVNVAGWQGFVQECWIC